jgi:nucleoside-diphosphate-sugar epimerase
MTKPVLVTGETGFVGQRILTKLRSQGILARIPVRDSQSKMLTQYHTGKSVEGCCAVIHCAGERRNWMAMEGTNYQLTKWLVDASLATGVKQFIYLHTSANARETDSFRHREYVRTKELGAQCVYAAQDKMNCVVAYLPTLYGGSGWRSYPIQRIKAVFAGRRHEPMQSVDIVVDGLVAWIS